MPSNQNPLGALPARFRRPRLLIVGCGDVGQRVLRQQARALQHGRGPRVLVLLREPARAAQLRAAGAVPLAGDLDAPATLARFAGLATQLLHLAPPPARGAHDTRTRALVQALRRRSAPRALVYVSTTGVYGDCAGQWVDESRPVAPATARAQRRVDAEDMLRLLGRSGGVRTSVLRAPGIYAADRAGGTPQGRLLRATPVLRAEDDVYTNHIHADDLARACLAALWRGRALRTYHASDASDLKMGDYFDLAADLYGLPRPPRVARAQAAEVLPATLLSFMGESRRLRTVRLARELRLVLRYPTVAEGLRG
ncbi:NAD-binding protein [Comamonas faecalis]|uniref:NAD-binding protein n=1 Tax=Comamonas faecalis TaxID=1387849 RepID=A0ABP7QFI0_9BURK